MKKRHCLCILLVATLASLLSCKQNSDSDPIDASISEFGCYITNCPYDYWSSSASSHPSLCYNFDLYFAGTFSVSDIVSAKVYINDTNNAWSFNVANYNKNSNSLTSYNQYYSSNSDELPIGKLIAKVVLTDGTEISKTIIMGIPGSKTNDIYQYTYNPDNERYASYPAVTMKAIQRPIINSFTRTSSSISVSFTITGDNINNGYVWYYDDNRNFIGYSLLFRDSLTGACYSGLNSGTGFNIHNGETNLFEIQNNSIKNNNIVITPTEFARITKARVVVTDGAQYETTDKHSYCDYRALSTLSN